MSVIGDRCGVGVVLLFDAVRGACVVRAWWSVVSAYVAAAGGLHGGNNPARSRRILAKDLAGTWLPATTNGTIPTYWIPVEPFFVIHFVIWPF